MKVLLLHLPHARRSYLSTFAVEEPLAHLYLAPVLQPAHDARLVDLRMSPQLERELGGFVPDAAVVGVNPLTVATLGPTLARLRALAPAIRILLVPETEYGNSHVTERPLDFVHPLADALIPNFALVQLRTTVPAVLAAWEARAPLEGIAGLLVRRDGRWEATTPVPNRVGAPGVPDRTLLGRLRGRYLFGGIGRMAHLFYTYGCLYKCRFCPMSKHDGSMLARPLEDVLCELAQMTEPNVYLQDFEPFLLEGAMEALAAALERERIQKRWFMMLRSDTALEQEELLLRWKRLGLRWIYLGLDGPTDQELKTIRKSNTVETNERAVRRLLDLGFRVTGGFVVRSDYTLEDFARLRSAVREFPGALIGLTVETPLVGTKLLDETEGRLTTRDWSLFDLSHAVLPTVLPLPVFYRELAKLHLAAGLRPLAALRHFPPRDIARTFLHGYGAVSRLAKSARDHETSGLDRRLGAAGNFANEPSMPHA